MQPNVKVIDDQEAIENLDGVDMASFYRTKWLMAHNRLHSVVHEPSANLTEEWSTYLSELQSAENLVRTPV